MARDSQVTGGHKANLNNPNTSDESKQHSKEVLENNDRSDISKNGGNNSNNNNTKSSSNSSGSSDNDDHEKNPNNVAGGLKATLKNPNVSEEAKESAKERLDEMGQEYDA